MDAGRKTGGLPHRFCPVLEKLSGIALKRAPQFCVAAQRGSQERALRKPLSAERNSSSARSEGRPPRTAVAPDGQEASGERL